MAPVILGWAIKHNVTNYYWGSTTNGWFQWTPQRYIFPTKPAAQNQIWKHDFLVNVKILRVTKYTYTVTCTCGYKGTTLSAQSVALIKACRPSEGHIQTFTRETK